MSELKKIEIGKPAVEKRSCPKCGFVFPDDMKTNVCYDCMNVCETISQFLKRQKEKK